MELEHAFWSEKRSANLGLAQTISVSFRFETLINDSILCYRLAVHLVDDPQALYLCVLNAQDCIKFTKNLAQFSKSLHELMQCQSSVLDLVQMPDDRLLMSLRSQQQDSSLPFFSAILTHASQNEQLQHMRLILAQLQTELAQERQLNSILKTQNEHLMLRLKHGDETSTLIRQTLEAFVGKEHSNHTKPIDSNDQKTSPTTNIQLTLPSVVQEKVQENLTASTSAMSANTSPSRVSVQLQETRDDLLLGIASYLLCAVCEKVSVPAANSTELSRHFIDAHVDDAKCLACPDANVFDLLSHIKSHTQRVYACEFCGKKGRKHYLKSHVRTHTGEKPFKCQTCGRKFADQSTIRRHQTTVHSMEKKFICPICGRDISRKDNYRVHLKSHSNSGTNAAGTSKQSNVTDQEKVADDSSRSDSRDNIQEMDLIEKSNVEQAKEKIESKDGKEQNNSQSQ